MSTRLLLDTKKMLSLIIRIGEDRALAQARGEEIEIVLGSAEDVKKGGVDALGINAVTTTKIGQLSNRLLESQTPSEGRLVARL